MEAGVAKAIKAHGHDALELEWRLGHVLGHFRPGVAEDSWERLKAELETSAAFVPTYVETHETIGDSCKRVDAGGNVTWIRKQRLADYDVGAAMGPWTVRTSVSVDIPMPVAPPTFVARFERHKRRWSFRHLCWSVDLTRVQGNTPNQLDADADVFEVEIELIDRDMLLERPLDSVVAWGNQISAEVCQLMSSPSVMG